MQKVIGVIEIQIMIRLDQVFVQMPLADQRGQRPGQAANGGQQDAVETENELNCFWQPKSDVAVSCDADVGGNAGNARKSR